MQKQYEKLMRRCITLAKKSEGKTSPNPLVGAVIFDDDFRIISEGRHEYYGGNHAERNAVFAAKEDLKGKSVIVNLEPCSHYGKTPPCATLLVEKGIKRVICGMVDPNEKVAGRGIKILEDAGIEVITGVLEDECRELNKIFIKNHTKRLPYITIKTATTLDGKIATGKYVSKWITDEASRAEVQKLRNKYDAILTGSGTVKRDNPSLTCRMKNGRNPVRIILDTNLTTDPMSNVYTNDGTRIIVVTSETSDSSGFSSKLQHVEILKCPKNGDYIDLKYMVNELFKLGIMSILVEAGSKVNKSFIDAKLPDELIQFIAPKLLGDASGFGFVEGFERNDLTECNILQISSTKRLKNDIMLTCRFRY